MEGLDTVLWLLQIPEGQHAIGEESVPIQLAQYRFPGLAISDA